MKSAPYPQTRELSAVSARLAALETFDPTAFIPDQNVPREVCSFVLALALAYNDIKDVIYAHLLLKEYIPSGQFQKRVDWGMFTGLKVHLIRYQLGLVHELCNLIREHQETIRHPFLQSVVTQMSKRSREVWNTLVATAVGQLKVGPLAQAVLRIRNKVIFHYDTKEILNGYKQHFFDGVTLKDRAYISRGQSMGESRFYFADAAAEGYLEWVHRSQSEELANNITEAIRKANLAIMLLVDTFIQRRGFHYRREKGVNS